MDVATLFTTLALTVLQQAADIQPPIPYCDEQFSGYTFYQPPLVYRGQGPLPYPPNCGAYILVPVPVPVPVPGPGYNPPPYYPPPPGYPSRYGYGAMR